MISIVQCKQFQQLGIKQHLHHKVTTKNSNLILQYHLEMLI